MTPRKRKCSIVDDALLRQNWHTKKSKKQNAREQTTNLGRLKHSTLRLQTEGGKSARPLGCNGGSTSRVLHPGPPAGAPRRAPTGRRKKGEAKLYTYTRTHNTHNTHIHTHSHTHYTHMHTHTHTHAHNPHSLTHSLTHTHTHSPTDPNPEAKIARLLATRPTQRVPDPLVTSRMRRRA